MKKLVSLLLVAVMVLSMGMVSVFAEGTEEKELLYKDKFVGYIGFPEEDPENDKPFHPSFTKYDEIYYHVNETSGEIDWALISVVLYAINPWEVVETLQIGDRVLKWWVPGAAVLPYGYAVYNVADDTFYDIQRVKPEEYDGFVEVIDELELGLPLGDVDMDSSVSVLDATEIQRYIAQLIEVPYGYYSYIPALADVEDDDEMNILDATALQVKLAQLEDCTQPNEEMVYSDFNNMYGVDTGIEEVPFETLYNGTQNYAGNKMSSERFAVIIKSKEQYDSVFSSYYGVEDVLDEEFFENKCLVASACRVTDAEMVAEISDVCVRYKTLFIRADKQLSDSDGVSEPIAPMYHSFVAVDKSYLAEVEEIIWL